MYISPLILQKTTGQPMVYEALLGKPSEVTFRYAEQCLSELSTELGQEQPIHRMYMIG